MPKYTLPIGKTCGKHRPCLRCFNCKTIKFCSSSKMEEWCYTKEVVILLPWRRRLKKQGSVRLYWCSVTDTGVRLFRISDKPFVDDCNLFTGSLICDMEIHNDLRK